MTGRILKIFFIAWVALWLWFLARALFVKGNLQQYAVLMSRPLEGKRSYVTGERLYEFLTFCSRNLPKGATYRLDGIEWGSIYQRKAAYYIYPAVEDKDPEYILVCDEEKVNEPAYRLFRRLDEGRYILKKR